MEGLLAHRPLDTQKLRSNENPSPRQVALKTNGDIKHSDDDVSAKVKHAALRVLVHRSVVGDAATQRFSPSKETTTTTLNSPTTSSHITSNNPPPTTTITHNTPSTTTPQIPTLSPCPPSPLSRESAIGVYNRIKNEDELSSNIRIKQAALRTLVQRSVMDSYEKTTVSNVTHKSTSSSDKDQSKQLVMLPQTNVIIDNSNTSNTNNVSSTGDVENDNNKGANKPNGGEMSSPPQSSPRSYPRSTRPGGPILLSSDDPTATRAAHNTTTVGKGTTAAAASSSSPIQSTSTKPTNKGSKTGRNSDPLSMSPLPSTPSHIPKAACTLLPSVLSNNGTLEVQKTATDRSKRNARQRALQAYRTQVVTTNALLPCLVIYSLLFLSLSSRRSQVTSTVDYDVRERMSCMRVLVLQSVVVEGTK